MNCTKRKIAFMQSFLDTPATHTLEVRRTEAGKDMGVFASKDGDQDSWGVSRISEPNWNFSFFEYRLVPKTPGVINV